MSILTDSAAEAIDPAQQAIAPGDRLETGMRMDAAEFRRRGDVLQAAGLDGRAELIEGVVTMMPPPDFVGHGEPDSDLQSLVGLYRLRTPGTTSATNAAVTFGDDTVVGPDLALAILPECGGQMVRTGDGRLTGVPELVIEVASSSAARDRGSKRQTYERIGVREYLVHDVAAGKFVQAVRRGDRLVEQTDEIFRSETFAGLWLDTAALLRSEAAEALQTLERGLASAEHAGFIRQLRDRRSVGQSETEASFD